MTIGTKSVLYGAHAFWLHPLFVLLGWWRLYGCPWDPRLWLAFLLHDLGYAGLPNMDGPEGERHPEWAARAMGRLFGLDWYWFCLLHSRYLAKKHSRPPSRLCFADKMAFVLTPRFLYVPMVWLTGEVYEYRAAHVHETGLDERSIWTWVGQAQDYVRRWVDAHVDGTADDWTKNKPMAITAVRRSDA